MRTAGRYALAIALVAIALVATNLAGSLLAPMRLLFLWSAILATALVAGQGPAMLAVALSTVAALVMLFEPYRMPYVHDPIDYLRVALFAFFAGAISYAVGLRRRAELRAGDLAEELHANELRYRTLVEASPVPQAVWTSTKEGRIQWSEELSVITGLEPQSLASDTSFAFVHPEDAVRTAELWEAARLSEAFYQDEVRVRVVAGRYRWFAVKGVPVRDRGEVREWVGIIVDIHDRKWHEEKAEFINRATDLLSSSLGYQQTMRNLARLCVPEIGDWCAIDIGEGPGYERLVVEHSDPARLELVNQLRDRVHGISENDPVAEVLRTGTSQLVEELDDELLSRIAASEDEVRLARELAVRSWIIAPMIARGRTLGALTVVHGESGRRYGPEDVPFVEDLARRAAMAIDNARLYEVAEAANRAKDDFLATLSHELRTPLTAITGWAHMLQLRMTDEATTQVAIETILRSAHAQGELIDDLLDISRVVAGTLHLEVSTVDLVRIVQDAVVAARPAADAKGLTCETRYPEAGGRALPVLVSGEERRLRQVVWNLLTNAVKFTESGGIVRAIVASDGRRASVTIEDTGQGIEPQFLPYVWDRFRQGDSSTSRRHGGLGLGLSVVKHLVELHGGTVQAFSEGQGQGAAFTITLPLARAAHEAPQAAQPRPAAGIHGRSILVVDENDDGRIVVTAMLRRAGARVATAASVEQALAMLEPGRFDAIVCDATHAPDAADRFVRSVAERSGPPVIAICEGPVPGGQDSGFARVLERPVTGDQLTAAVTAVVP